ncbi:pentapeptide repeat-containing protein [Gammaproteobacteria bacterium]|nr:pentapeptide repeat-containing protein [Gammaproteobacteria bacterium]
MIDREYISLEELKARPENKKFFEILAAAPDRGTFVDQWNKYALSKEAQALEDGLNFSRFKFDDDPETVKCFRFLCFEYLEEIKESLGDHIWNFSGLIFPNTALFSSAQFNSNANFYKSQFKGVACFDDTKFNSDAYFCRAQFIKYANFNSAQFKSPTSFDDAQFLDGMHFANTVFAQHTNFKNLHTKLIVNLYRTTFHKEIYISFKDTAEIICQDTVFNGYTSLDITNCQKLPNFAAAHFNDTQHLTITDNRFEGKDDARFAVTQRDKQEKETHKPVDTYRFLKNYYAKDNHLKAKHAYFKLELKHTFPFWHWLYNLVSNCGLSVWRPLLFLMLGCLFAYCITQYLEAANCWQGGNILIRTINPLYFKCHEATNILSSFWLVAHTLWNGLMLFLIGLGLRNKLKLKH